MSTKRVVLIHGWGGSYASTWQEPGICDLLIEAGFEVTGIDLLGHGKSLKPHEPSAYNDLSRQLLEELPTEPVIAVGFSLGALTLLRAAIDAPERFIGLVLAGIGDGVFQPSRPEETEQILAGIEGRAEPDDNLARLFAQYAHRPDNDPLALAAILQRAPQSQLTPAMLTHISAPVLVAIGEKDFAAPAEKLCAAFSNSSLSILPRIDHFATPNSFPFIDALLSWLETRAT